MYASLIVRTCKSKISNLFFIVQVSWIRHKDLRILAVGPYAYTNDDRFMSVIPDQISDDTHAGYWVTCYDINFAPK
jgi:hypothetical protein